MPHALRRRLDRLESRLHEAPAADDAELRPCPACGGGARGTGRSSARDAADIHQPQRVTVTFADASTPDPAEPRRCPQCGRQLEFRIEFDSRG